MTTPQGLLPGDVQEERSRACKALGTALGAAGLISFWERIGWTAGEPAVSVSFAVRDGLLPLAHDDVSALPAPDVAGALQRDLWDHGIHAQVTLIRPFDPALRFDLESAQCAHRLTELLIRSLPEPDAAAHRLRTALTSAGIDAENLCIRRGERDVSIGNISATDAITLVEVLHGGDCCVAGLDQGGWAELDTLAEKLSHLLTEIAGRRVGASADPVCSRCPGDHEITLATVSAETARLLAAAIEQADEPHRHLVQFPPVADESAQEDRIGHHRGVAS
ncbi:hypothetical protein ACIBK8_28650 [Streptomyces sp. NPDC050161]|uniref:hypothetical protein n=1 Tax=Streptomyces sp. NPDC050161 TaxID=3365604 RepID=UPI00378ADCBC